MHLEAPKALAAEPAPKEDAEKLLLLRADAQAAASRLEDAERELGESRRALNDRDMRLGELRWELGERDRRLAELRRELADRDRLLKEDVKERGLWLAGESVECTGTGHSKRQEESQERPRRP